VRSPVVTNLGLLLLMHLIAQEGALATQHGFLVLVLSAFRTREVRQPTSEFVVVCPCPDGLMQDGTQEGK
jgi:orotidine-5'-phosphate decarboxylase